MIWSYILTSLILFTGLPSNSTTTSPGRNPAKSAGEPGVTWFRSENSYLWIAPEYNLRITILSIELQANMHVVSLTSESRNEQFQSLHLDSYIYYLKIYIYHPNYITSQTSSIPYMYISHLPQVIFKKHRSKHKFYRPWLEKRNESHSFRGESC